MFSYRLAGAIVVILLIVSSRDAGESLNNVAASQTKQDRSITDVIRLIYKRGMSRTFFSLDRKG